MWASTGDLMRIAIEQQLVLAMCIFRSIYYDWPIDASEESDVCSPLSRSIRRDNVVVWATCLTLHEKHSR